MLIYKRHIITNIVTPLITIMLTMTGLVWMSQVVKLIYLIDKGVGFVDFMSLIILVLPSLFFTILPFSMVIGILVSYNRLSYERELIVLSNSGMSPLALAKPGLIVATIVTFIGYFISIYLLPISYSALKSNLYNFRNNYASSLLQERVFTQVAKNVTLYVDDKSGGGLLKGIIIFDDRNIDQRVIIFAKSGRVKLDSLDPSFALHNGMRQELDQLGNMNKMYFSTLSVALNQDKCKPGVMGQEGADSVKASDCNTSIDQPSRDLQEYYIGELLAPDHTLGDTRLKKLKSAGHQRLLWPLYSFGLTVLALGIFMQKPYSRSGNRTILTKIGVVLVVMTGMHFAAHNASSKYEIMNLFCYINIGICFLFGYLLLTETMNFPKRLRSLLF